MKHKAKRIDNGEWVYGWLIGDPESQKGVFVVTYYFIVMGKNGKNTVPHKSLEYYEVDPKTLCKITPFKDIAGKEIYEGDRISDNRNKNMIVKYGKFNVNRDDYGLEYNPVGFYVEFADRTTYILNDDPKIQYAIRADKSKIIGNIHNDTSNSSNINNELYCFDCGSENLIFVDSFTDGSHYKCKDCDRTIVENYK